MAFLARLSHVPSRLKYVDVRHGSGLKGHLVETAEYLGASYLAGRVNTQYGDRAKYRGVEITYGGGILLKLLAVIADVTGYGDGWAPHANSISTAMIGAHLAALGAKDGLQASGRSLPAGPSAPAVHGVTSMGAIPPAAEPNKYLNRDEISRIAAMHG